MERVSIEADGQRTCSVMSHATCSASLTGRRGRIRLPSYPEERESAPEHVCVRKVLAQEPRGRGSEEHERNAPDLRHDTDLESRRPQHVVLGRASERKSERGARAARLGDTSSTAVATGNGGASSSSKTTCPERTTMGGSC